MDPVATLVGNQWFRLQPVDRTNAPEFLLFHGSLPGIHWVPDPTHITGPVSGPVSGPVKPRCPALVKHPNRGMCQPSMYKQGTAFAGAQLPYSRAPGLGCLIIEVIRGIHSPGGPWNSSGLTHTRRADASRNAAECSWRALRSLGCSAREEKPALSLGAGDGGHGGTYSTGGRDACLRSGTKFEGPGSRTIHKCLTSSNKKLVETSAYIYMCWHGIFFLSQRV